MLWGSGPSREPAWDSLWGRGRPGWHIECSALVVRELGVTIDLHGGGSDLIFPHHECEAAQSQAATGELFVRHWMHTGDAASQGTKMSKSLGNLVFVRDLLKSWDPGAIRLAILANHYRSDWEWQDDLLVQGLRRLTLWRAGYQGAGSAGRGPGHPHPAAALAGGPEATPIGVSAPKPGQLHGPTCLTR